MNKYTLKFIDSKIENEYQQFRKRTVLKKVYWCMLPLSFILNSLKIAIDLTNNKHDQLYANSINLAAIFIGIILVKTNDDYLSFVISGCSILTSLLQINLDPKVQHNQDYYNFGCIVTAFQSILYFLSDFPQASIQAISHTTIRLCITSTATKYVDVQDYLFSLFTIIFQFVVLYKCDENSRNHFLLRVKEDQWDRQLIELINQPFCQFKYISEELKFDLVTQNQLTEFPIYNQDFCDGCNFRQFLRFAQIEQNLSLESFLINLKKNLINNSVIIQLINISQYQLKFVNLGVESQKLILILEKKPTIEKKVNQNNGVLQIKKEVMNTVKCIFHDNRNTLELFKIGVFSIFMLNSKVIMKINLTQRILKCIKLFNNFGYKFKLLNKDKIYINSYSNLINIFLIQLFLICLNHQENEVFLIDMMEAEQLVQIKIKLKNFVSFEEEFKRNFFINQIKSKILVILDDSNEFYISLIKLVELPFTERKIF